MEGEKTVVLGKSTVLFIVEYSRHWYGGSGGVERAFFSCPGYPVPRSAPETYSNPYPVVSISLRELGGAFKVTSQCFNWQSKLEAEFCISVTRSASGRIMLETADSSLLLWHPFFTTRAKLGVIGSNGEPKHFPHHSLR